MVLRIAALLLLAAVAVSATDSQHERLSPELMRDVQETLGVSARNHPHDSVDEVSPGYFQRAGHSLLSAADTISANVENAAEDAMIGGIEYVDSAPSMVQATYANDVDPAFLLETASAEEQVELLDSIANKAHADAQEFDIGLLEVEEAILPVKGGLPGQGRRPIKVGTKAPTEKKTDAPKVDPKKKAPTSKDKRIKLLAKVQRKPGKATTSRKARRRSQPRRVKAVAPAAARYVMPEYKDEARANSSPRAGQRVLVRTRNGPVWVQFVAKGSLAAAGVRARSAKLRRQRRATRMSPQAARRFAARRAAMRAAIMAARRVARRRMRRARRAQRARRMMQARANIQYDPVTNTIIRHVHNHHYIRAPVPRRAAKKERCLRCEFVHLAKLQRAIIRKFNARARRAVRPRRPSVRRVMYRAAVISNRYNNAQSAKTREASRLRAKYARHLQRYQKAQKLIGAANAVLRRQARRQTTARKQQRAKRTESKAARFRRMGCRRAVKGGRTGWLCPRHRRAAARRPAAAAPKKVVASRAKKVGKKVRFSTVSSTARALAESAAVMKAAAEAESYTQQLEDQQLMRDAELVAEDADVALAVANQKLEAAETDDDLKF